MTGGTHSAPIPPGPTPGARRHRHTRLDPHDAVLVFGEGTGHRSHLVAVNFFDTTHNRHAEPDQECAIAWVRARLHHSELFSRRLQREPFDLDHPYWVPATPLLERHVRVHAAAGPGWPPVAEILAGIVGTRMDLDLPLWEIHVVTGIRDVHDMPVRMVAVLLKIHHCAADGIATRDLVNRLFSDSYPTCIPTLPETTPDRRTMTRHAIADAPAKLAGFLHRLLTTRQAQRRVSAKAPARALPGTRQFPPTPLNARAGGGIGIDFLALPLHTVQAVRHAVPGATVNDVVLAVVAGGLRELFGVTGETTVLGAKVPRSVRAAHRWTAANQLVLLPVPLHNNIADPLTRLRRITQASNEAKDRSKDGDLYLRSALTASCPAPLLRLRSWQAHLFLRRGRGNTMVSNIAFESDGARFRGAPSVGALGTQPPIDGDLLRHFLTWRDPATLLLTVCADTSAVRDATGYCGLLEAAFDELVSAASGR